MNWPTQGKVECQDVELRYRPTTEKVLKGTSFEVTAGHKIGIVGRTGAGKSTITMTILRLLEAMQGKILIDDVDISLVPLQ